MPTGLCKPLTVLWTCKSLKSHPFIMNCHLKDVHWLQTHDGPVHTEYGLKEHRNVTQILISSPLKALLSLEEGLGVHVETKRPGYGWQCSWALLSNLECFKSTGNWLYQKQRSELKFSSAIKYENLGNRRFISLKKFVIDVTRAAQVYLTKNIHMN